MAVVNREQRFVFLCEHHTASRGTVKALVESVPGSVEFTPHHSLLNRIPDVDDFKIIATVRNPFDTIVSKYYHFGYSKELMFTTYVQRILNRHHGRPAVGLWRSATELVRYETLRADLEALFGGIRLEWDDNHRSVGKRKWQDYYVAADVDRLMSQPEFRHYWERFYGDTQPPA